uniref:Fe(II)-dependent 2-oxoglutarate dioxygenase n=1 Tax=Amycolatopsis sp. SANK 60206 TaxID=1642649 RepID=A0A0E3USM7_9PSEU|nr:Fe(II)-dependent 2-oxoglutarate dioxygenase [Amycolatopsis sp. SANK 60206]
MLKDPVVDCTSSRQQLLALAGALPRLPRVDIYAFLEAAKEQADKLPEHIGRALDEFNVGGNQNGYLSLKGLPVEPDDELPPTPTTTPPPADRELLNMEAMLAIVGRRLGLHTAYDQGYGNRRAREVLHELYPTPDAHPLSGETSSTQLEYHSDLYHHALQPQYIILSCSRGDHEGKAATLVGSIRNALPLLSDEVIERLFERKFARPVGISHGDRIEDSSSLAYVKPLYGDRDDPFLGFDRSVLRADEQADKEALAELDSTLDSVAKAVRLGAGDLLIIDNLRVAHARTPFEARWDGKDRWLHRAYVRTAINGQLTGGERAGDVVEFIARR